MSPHDDIPAEMLDAAAVWLARRDRGLTPAEQDEYMQWLAADPRHAEAFGRHAATLERMMQLYEWTPAHDTEPNPDLFAPPPARRRFWPVWTGVGLAAAAALTLLLSLSRPAERAAAIAPVAQSYLRVNERMALPDGSRAELKDGTQLVVQYSEVERRVRLNGGEVHFTVWKDPQRPFVVEAAGIEVRAIGTAFNVRLQPDEVQVLVTEGRVQVDAPQDPVSGAGMPVTMLSKGQKAIVPRSAQVGPVVEPVTAVDIARELAWQAPRLQFQETPLAAAVAEFNRLNRHQLELADPALEELRIGGTFRPDNVDGFVRLLNTTLGLDAEPSGPDRTVLRRAP
ncbi:MAG: FecR domain-containing protein [Opitutaceae bacterium]|nr:FecR domain-containing protein [Cephaloticoccus sp.]MCP5531523.1 FecR domain-containing protein [Opitutaceae bacterium]